VLHVASHVTNVGDGALNSVIRARLSALADEPLEITLEDVVLRPRNLLASDVDEFDLVVVGGGGAISSGASNDLSGLALPMAVDEMEASRVPFAFVALGHNLFYGDELRAPDLLRWTLAWSAQRGHPFSVRNDGSGARMQADFGADADHIVEVPDPGMFVPPSPVVPAEVGQDDFVLLQVASDRLDDRLLGASRGSGRRAERRGAGARRHKQFVDAMVAWCRSSAQAHDVDVVLAPHIPTDVALVSEILDGCYAKGSRAGFAHRPFRLLGTPHPRNALHYFGHYAAARAVVGMRGHAVICGVGLGRPVVALSTHPKVRGFMEACDLDPWVIEPGPDLAMDLTAAVDPLIAGATEDYDRRRNAATGTLSEQLDDLLRAALAHASNR
jgi:hypothetical protein